MKIRRAIVLGTLLSETREVGLDYLLVKLHLLL
jgi:hypothetical protein